MPEQDEPRYADRTCDGCAVILPGHQMTRFQRELMDVRTVTPRQHKVGGNVTYRDTEGFKSRVVHEWLCPSCYGAEIDRERTLAEEREARRVLLARQRAMRRGVVAFLVVAIIVALAAFVITAKDLVPAVMPANDTVASDGIGNADTTAIPSAPVPTVQPPQEAPAPPPIVQSAAIPPSPSRQEDSRPDAGPDADMPSAGTNNPGQDGADQAILAVTSRALEDGEPARWRFGDQHGYVVPSAEQDYGDQRCRNVYATSISGGSQTRSDTHRWCKEGDEGDWTPR